MDVLYDLTKKLVARLGQDKDKPVGPALGQIGCCEVANKADFLDCGIDLFDGFLFDAMAAIQDSINSCPADASHSREVFRRWAKQRAFPGV